MPTTTPFRIPVADLLRRPGAHARRSTVAAPLADVRGPGAEIAADQPIDVDVTLERVSDGIVVRGTITRALGRGRAAAAWRRSAATLAVHVDELFERHPLDGETYLLDDDVIDLEPLVRDALLLELPAVPLCRADCPGLCPSCGIDRNVTTCDCTTDELDPRWAALRSLDL